MEVLGSPRGYLLFQHYPIAATLLFNSYFKSFRFQVPGFCEQKVFCEIPSVASLGQWEGIVSLIQLSTMAAAFIAWVFGVYALCKQHSHSWWREAMSDSR